MGARPPSDFLCRARCLLDSGVRLFQLRDKQLADRELLERARQLRSLLPSDGIMIVNDRPDIARLSGAHGVHVGQDEVSVSDARAILGVGRLVGVSTHTIEQARQAVLDGADYLGCGPTFKSNTKDFSHFAGPEFLRQVAAEICLPAFAIGGIDLTNLRQVREAGFSRVAVGAAIPPPPGTERGKVAGELLTALRS